MRISRGALFAGVLLSQVGLAAFVSTCGEVTKIELSPETFEHRTVRYYQVPLVEVRVSPRWTDPWSTPLADYLKGEGYLDPIPTEQRWNMIKGYHWGVRGWIGRARHLCRALDCWGNADARWVAWSKDHPEIARELWPTVVQAARDGEYDLAAWAVRSAEDASSVEAYRRELAIYTD